MPVRLAQLKTLYWTDTDGLYGRTRREDHIYVLERPKFLRQKLKNGFAAGDASWRVQQFSATPTDENRLCPVSIRALC